MIRQPETCTRSLYESPMDLDGVLADLVLKNTFVSYEQPKAEDISDHQITVGLLTQLSAPLQNCVERESPDPSSVSSPSPEKFEEPDPTVPEQDFDLYRGLVDISLIPEPIKLPDDLDIEPTKLSATIISDTELIIGDQTLKLRGNQMHIFNALLLKRNQWQTSRDIIDSGTGLANWHEDPTKTINAFTTTTKELSKKLKKCGVPDLIIRIGKRNIGHVLNPGLEIFDERPVGSGNMPGSLIKSEKIIQKEGTEAQRERDIPIKEISKAYGKHPETLKLIAQYEDSRVEASVENINFVRHVRLYEQDTLALFADIENGLRTYKSISDFKNPTKEQEESLIKLTAAYHTIIVTNIPLVMRSVKNYPRYAYGLEDYIQEGVIGLANAAMRFDPGRKYKFSTLAVRAIRHRVKDFIVDKSDLARENEAFSLNQTRDSKEVGDAFDYDTDDESTRKSIELSYINAATEWLNQSIEPHDKLVLSLYLGLPLEGAQGHAEEFFDFDYLEECEKLAKSGKDNAYAVARLLGMRPKDVTKNVTNSLMPLSIYAKMSEYTKE